MPNRLTWAMLTIAASALCGSGAAAQPTPDRQACFYPNQLESWIASPDARTIYVRVGASKIYRMDLATPCPTLRLPMASLELRLHGAPVYCSAMSFELWARPPRDTPEYCSVARLSLLGSEETAALPRNLRP